MHCPRNVCLLWSVSSIDIILLKGLNTTGACNRRFARCDPLAGAGDQEIPGKGRGVVLKEPVKASHFVLEYKTSSVYPRAERAAHEDEYAANDEGCMIFEVQTPHGWMCLDATRRHTTTGRLLNHAPCSPATLRPFNALLIEGKWRVGMLAAKDLPAGTELTLDYGCAPEGQEWLFRRGPATPIPAGISLP